MCVLLLVPELGSVLATVSAVRIAMKFFFPKNIKCFFFHNFLLVELEKEWATELELQSDTH